MVGKLELGYYISQVTGSSPFDRDFPSLALSVPHPGTLLESQTSWVMYESTCYYEWRTEEDVCVLAHPCIPSLAHKQSNI